MDQQDKPDRNDVPVKRFALRTSDGLALRAERAEASSTTTDTAVVVCHPHPLHGGNMFNSVVGIVFDGSQQRGLEALRFNFRGTNGSEGHYDNGVGEQLDALAAVNALAESGQSRIVVVGYSFGADIVLQTDHPSIVGWVAIAPPLMLIDGNSHVAAAGDGRPTLVLAGSEDQFRSADAVSAATINWNNTVVKTLDGADHFLADEFKLIQQLTLDFVTSL